MQSSQKEKDIVHANEVLSFPHAELHKRDHGENKIIDVGIFTVLYFPNYSRYVVYLGDWSYALLRRLPVVASVNMPSDSHCYTFPAYMGNYVVKINGITYPEGIMNLETILKHNSHFSYEGEELGQKQREPSPYDKFTELEEHGDSSKEKEATETGKLIGKEKVKKGLKRFKSMFTSHYSYEREWNINLMQVRDYAELQSSGVDHLCFHHYISRKEVEASIVRSKDIAQTRGYSVGPQESAKEEDQEKDNVNYNTKSTVIRRPEEELFKEREAKLIEQIENERRLQELERECQERHKQKELHHIQRERELENLIRAQHQEHATQQMHRMKSQIQQKQDIFTQQERLGNQEAQALSNQEKQLQDELEEFQTYSKIQNVHEVPKSIEKNQQRMGIDVANCP